MDYQTITLQKEDGIATITLNRPDKMNSVDGDMITELEAATIDVGQDDSVKVIILTGAGRAFCAGGDLESPMYSISNTIEMEKIIQQFGRVVLNLRNMPKPVIAAVNGATVGAGLGFALACDILIASDKARFGHGYTNIGGMSDSGVIYFLPRLVGTAKACELIFTARIIDANEAERMGLVNQVVPADALEATTRELALKMTKMPPAAIGAAKTSLYQALTMDLPTALEYEARGHTMFMLSEDMKEGIKAFWEKRQAVYKGN